jgi:signal transduction histidine kinase
MSIRRRLAIATAGVVLLVVLGFEASLFADLASEHEPAVAAVLQAHAVRAVVFGLMAAGVAALIASVLVGTRVLQPLTSIVDAAARLARDGDFGRRLPNTSRDPEVVALTRTFNGLIERVDRVLSAQRQLLADTSHELRTPLTTVRGNLDLLARELPPGERAEVLAETREEVDRMARLVRDLLELADSTDGQGSTHRLDRVALRLDLIVREVVERVAVPGDMPRVRIEDEPVLVRGDDEKLRQLVGNLVQNALRHATSAPGAIRVSVRHQPPNAELVVEDDGPGIPPAALERVFDRFFRVDRARSRTDGGTGLGLSIVRHVAEAHGGRAWAANRTDGRSGARFSVELPAEPSWARNEGAFVTGA